MVRAAVTLALWESDARFRLPANGTPSLQFMFVGADGDVVFLGARAFSEQVDVLAPGTACEGVLEFWADEPASEVVKPGTPFEVHYPRQVGTGQIRAILS